MKNNSFIAILLCAYFCFAIILALFQYQLNSHQSHILFLLVSVLSSFSHFFVMRFTLIKVGPFAAFYATLLFAVPSAYATVYATFDWVIKHDVAPFLLWFLNCILILISGAFASRLLAPKTNVQQNV